MYLGIDLGTSGVKVIVLDDKDNLLAQSTMALEVSTPKTLWSEQNPDHWWQATCSAIEEIKHKHPILLKQIQAIGLAGQMHGATLLDEKNQIIRPAILWNDGRCAAECDELKRAEPNLESITGNIAMPGFTAPKLLWVKKHEPEQFARIKKVLLPKDYLRYLMTGDFASDMSDSSGTLWLDVNNRSWSEKMLAATGLNETHMPKLYEGNEITGYLDKPLAQQWGMQQVPVVAGAGDNAAGAIGMGIIQPKQAFLSLGTSGVYFVANERFSPNPTGTVHAFCHSLPNLWHQMSVILSAASCLSWVTKLTQFPSEQNLLNEVEKLDFSQPNPVIFLPYLSGERTPHNNPDAQGVFIGLNHNTSPAILARAVLEGVAFAFADAQQVLLDAKTDIDHVSVIGGGSRSLLWLEILASVLNKPLKLHEGSDVGPAYGAARLAHLAMSKQPIDTICSQRKVKQIIHPNLTMSAYYSQQLQKFRDIYQNIQAYF